MESINITNARQNLYNLAEKTIHTNTPIKITSEKGNIVMMSEEEYSALQETVYLSNFPGMVESVLEAADAPDEEFLDADEIDWDVLGSRARQILGAVAKRQ